MFKCEELVLQLITVTVQSEHVLPYKQCCIYKLYESPALIPPLTPSEVSQGITDFILYTCEK